MALQLCGLSPSLQYGLATLPLQYKMAWLCTAPCKLRDVHTKVHARQTVPVVKSFHCVWL